MAEDTSVTTSAIASTTPPPRKRRWLRTLLITVGVLVLLLALLVVLLPTILSTGPGTRWVLGVYNDSIKGHVTADDFDIGWTGGVQFQGVTLYDPDGTPVLKAQQILANDLTVLGLARGSQDYGTIRILNPVATVRQDASGQINLAQALEPAQPSPTGEPPSSREDLSLNLELVDGHVTVEAPELDPIELRDLSVYLKIPDIRNIQATVKGKVVQKDATGAVDVELALQDMLDAYAQPQWDQGRLELRASLTDAPTAVIARLAQQPIVAPLLGSTISATVAAQGNATNLQAQLKSHSEHFSADAALAIDDGNLSLGNERAQVTLTVTREAAEEARTLLGQDSPAQLAEVFTVTIDLNELSGRIENGTLDPATFVARLALAISNVVLDTGGELGRITLADTRGELSYDGPSEQQATLALQSLAQQPAQGREGRLNLSVDAQNVLNPDWQLDRSAMTLTADAGIEQWPMVVVDELLALGNLVQQSIGSSLDTTFHAELQPAEDSDRLTGQFQLTANAANLEADLGGQLGTDSVSLAADSVLRWHVHPETIDALRKRVPALGDLALAEETTLELIIAAAQAVLDPAKLGMTSLNARLTLAPTRIDLGGETGIISLADTQVTIESTQLSESIKLTATSALTHAEQAGRLALDADVRNLVTVDGQVQLAGMTANIDGELRQFPVALIDAIAAMNGQLVESIGSTLDSDLSASPRQRDDGELETSFAISATAPHATLEAQGVLERQQARVEPGALVTATLRDEWLQTLLATEPQAEAAATDGGEAPAEAKKPLRLAQPAMLRAELGEVIVPLGEGADTNQIQLALAATIDSIALAGDPPLDSIALQALKLDVPQTTLGETLRATLTGTFVSGEDRGDLHVEAALQNALAETRSGNIDARLSSVPVALVDELMHQNGRLNTWLGRQLDNVTATVAIEPEQPIGVTAAIDSQRLRSEIAGQYAQADTTLTVSKGWLEYTLTPEAAVALQGGDAQQPGSVTLSEAATVRATIEQLVLALADQPDAQQAAAAPAAPPAPSADGPPSAEDTSAGGLDLARSAAVLDVKVPQLAFRTSAAGDMAAGEYRLSNVTLRLNAPQLHQQVELNLEGQMTSTAGGTQPFHSRTTVANLTNEAGEFSMDSLTLQTDTQLTDLPAALLVALAGLDQQYARAVGATANIAAVGSLPGDLDVAVKSPNLDLPLALTIDRDRQITLRDDFQGQVRINEDTSALLGTMSPILADAQASDEPALIFVQRDDFLVPLSAENVVTAMRAQGRIEMGTLTLDQSWIVREYVSGLTGFKEASNATLGNLGKGVGTLLGVVGEVTQTKELTGGLNQLVGQVDRYVVNVQPMLDGPADYRFTPLHFVIRDGQIITEDLWITSDQLALGIRGTVDLGQQNVDMKLGIPGQTLFMALPMVTTLNVVKADAIYELPIKGPIGGAAVPEKEKKAFFNDKLLGSVLSFLGPVGRQVGKALDPGAEQREENRWSHFPDDWAPAAEMTETSETAEEPGDQPVQQQPAQGDVLTKPVQPAQQQDQQAAPAEKKPEEAEIDLLGNVLGGIRDKKEREREREKRRQQEQQQQEQPPPQDEQQN